MQDTLKVIRHSAAELLAIAVNSLFPKVQLVSGEATSLGFYYDFFFPDPIGQEQLAFIEERMRDFIRQDMPIKIMEMMRKNAIELFKHHHQDLKVALLKANVETLVHVCQIGQFYDLGYPPFVESTQQIGVIKLLSINSFTVSLPGRPNLSLTRIQGTAFPDNVSLKDFLKKSETAKERDHRRLGKEMHLFTNFEENCPGCWSWLPKGALIRDILMDWWRKEHREQKFQAISTSNLLKPSKLDSSGPFLNFLPESPQYQLSSTKASMHSLVFKTSLHSYRELPIRYCEYDTFYEQEKEAHLWGMLRARAFTADNSFIFCTPDQVLDELISSLQFITRTFKILGFEASWHLISKNQSSGKFSREWAASQESLIKALGQCGLDYTLERGETLYGPTLVMRFTDVLGRKWKGPYVYIDLYHPEKFGLRYQGQDDRMHAPVMVGRSMYGSLERLMAILIEHYAGKWPLWLAPEQVRVIPIADKQCEYAAQISEKIRAAGFRVSVDYRKENLGAKVHAAESERIPYMVVVGDYEEKSGTIALRKYLLKEVQENMALEDFLEKMRVEIETTD